MIQSRVTTSMGLWEEYRRSRKAGAVEEFFDLAFHRPIAFLFVRSIARFPVSANHLSVVSILVSLLAAILIGTSDPSAVAIAGILILAGNILDCADGQLARLKGQETPMGRIVDGAADYVSLISIFLALALWQPPDIVPPGFWIPIVLLSMLAFGWQSSLVDYYRNEYSHRLSGRVNFIRSELDLQGSGAERQKTSFQRIALRAYASYLRMLRSMLNADSLDEVRAETYVLKNSLLIRLWCLNGSATPRFLLGILCFFNRLELLPAYLLIAGTGWTLTVLLMQQRSDRHLARSLERRTA